jgi:hypothetical protein
MFLIIKMSKQCVIFGVIVAMIIITIIYVLYQIYEYSKVLVGNTFTIGTIYADTLYINDEAYFSVDGSLRGLSEKGDSSVKEMTVQEALNATNSPVEGTCEPKKESGNSTVTRALKYLHLKGADAISFELKGTNDTANSLEIEPYLSSFSISSSNPAGGIFIKTLRNIGTIEPSTDGDCNLGSTGYRFNNLYAKGIYNTGDISISSGSGGVYIYTPRTSGHVLPVTNSTYDLGSTDYKYRNGYFSSTVYAPIIANAGDLTIGTNTGNSVIFSTNTVRPDNTSCPLGTSTYKFTNGWFSGTVNCNAVEATTATITTLHASVLSYATDITIGTNTGRSVIFSTNTIRSDGSACPLGTSSYKFTDGWFSGTVNCNAVSAASILPTVSGSQDLGDSGHRFRNLYAGSIISSSSIVLTAGDGFLIPSTDFGMNIGSPHYRFADAYFEGVVNCNIVSTISGILPTVSGAVDIGDSTHRWKNLYASGIINSGNLTITAGDGYILPSTASGLSLGSDSVPFKDAVFSGHVYAPVIGNANGFTLSTNTGQSITVSSTGFHPDSSTCNIGESNYKFHNGYFSSRLYSAGLVPNIFTVSIPDSTTEDYQLPDGYGAYDITITINSTSTRYIRLPDASNNRGMTITVSLYNSGWVSSHASFKGYGGSSVLTIPSVDIMTPGACQRVYTCTAGPNGSYWGVVPMA